MERVFLMILHWGVFHTPQTPQKKGTSVRDAQNAVEVINDPAYVIFN